MTRKRGEAVIMVSLADWRAMEETLRLLSSPVNAERLRGAINELEAGRGAEPHPAVKLVFAERQDVH